MAAIKLKVGDKVTVYRKARYSYWVPCMDNMIGRSGTVTAIRTPYTNMYSSVPDAKLVFDNDGEFYFPTASLKHNHNHNHNHNHSI